jgi:predicted phosphodiesterase
LSDIRKRGADHLLNLGDIVYGPLDPEATAQLLQQFDMPSTTIWGNEDRILFEDDADTRTHASLEFTRSHLTADSLDWLSQFPPQASVGDVVFTHGVPGDDETYLLEKVDSGGRQKRPPEEIGHLLSDLKVGLVLCGHSHLPGKLQIPGGPLVANPGSIGLQAYSDITPFPHVMEMGSPHARYALAEKTDTGWSIELIALDYDWEAAAQVAESNGRADWAYALRTGFAEQRSAQAAAANERE